ncbi:hypothetical protein DW986_03245 [Parabacteroides merdae]|jgi:hypothetical protein|uniref:Uncharacterized protein n=1 Tax=Parabacteroides merdae TaxID=46503 RepID=A0A414XL79_9BACT|nr:hypothetical protein [Parabacteroides merdae]RGZ50295.1 hypothetical protein DW986_03245 [Parabacteroides merdae]RHH74680.1 hypothetical protein DW191_17345 [Parabacteroides merdae]DAY51107.1 MAG TPA: hypothetical protein [Caudoviricetes sp.]
MSTLVLTVAACITRHERTLKTYKEMYERSRSATRKQSLAMSIETLEATIYHLRKLLTKGTIA